MAPVEVYEQGVRTTVMEHGRSIMSSGPRYQYILRSLPAAEEFGISVDKTDGTPVTPPETGEVGPEDLLFGCGSLLFKWVDGTAYPPEDAPPGVILNTDTADGSAVP